MRPSTLRFRIILPLALLIVGAMFLFHAAVILLTVRLSEEYHDLIAASRSRQIESIVELAVSELVLGNLLDQNVVVEAKKRAAVEEIYTYMRNNGLQGEIRDHGRVLRSTAMFGNYREEVQRAPPEGTFHFYRGLTYIKGAVTQIPAWDWTVITLSPPVGILIQPTRAIWFIPIVLGVFVLLLGSVWLFLKHNLTRPFQQVLSDISEGRPVKATGIEEIDRLGSTINRTVGDLTLRNQQMKLLHDAAILLNRSGQTREVLTALLEAANRLLGASHGAIVVFSAGNAAPSLVLRRGDCETAPTGPHCIELWRTVLQRDLGVRLNGPETDPVFGPLCARCCVPIKNIIAWGIRSLDRPGRELVMVFGNKQGGFSEEDGRMVRILAADVLETIGRMDAETSLRGALEEKQVLLKEVHHRVKNNLQVISGLLTLQAAHLPAGDARTVFRESQDRIITMALIHEKLYESDDLARVEFAGYMESLLHGLQVSYGARGKDVVIHREVEHLSLVVDTAIPSALIINELVSNSLKHAFTKGRGGTVRVRFGRCGGGSLFLEVADDGVGLPPGLDPLKGKTLGLKLIAVLGQQLGGTWKVGEGPGTSWRLEFKEYYEAGTALV